MSLSLNVFQLIILGSTVHERYTVNHYLRKSNILSVNSDKKNCSRIEVREQ